jgi:hypothetical protein
MRPAKASAAWRSALTVPPHGSSKSSPLEGVAGHHPIALELPGSKRADSMKEVTETHQHQDKQQYEKQ